MSYFDEKPYVFTKGDANTLGNFMGEAEGLLKIIATCSVLLVLLTSAGLGVLVLSIFS